MSVRLLARSLSRFLIPDEVSLDDLDRQDAGRIRAAQINAVVQLVPLTMPMNVLNAWIIVQVFWDSAIAAFLLAWATMISLAAAAAMVSWQRTRRHPPDTASPRALRRMTLHAFVLAAAWGAAPLMLFPHADPVPQLMLACVAAGMISGGAFGLSTVPRAGLTYTWTLTLASAAAILATGEAAYIVVALFLLIYAVFTSRNLVAHGIVFVDHLRDQVKLRSQGDVIGLLLKDFQENASDWLWETDVDGRLTFASKRFAEAAEMKDISSALLSDILLAGAGDDGREAVEEILRLMSARVPFRDVVVPLQVGGKQRFWSMTAKPVLDNAHVFIGYRGVGADITDKRQAEERISYLACYDPVTRLPNRFSFHQQADRAVRAARANATPVGLLYLDLDHFKSVNDTLGHPIGDELLAAVGECLEACASDGDVVARLGGDEFAILSRSPSQPQDTIELARRILAALQVPLTLEHSEIAMTASIGIAIAPIHAEHADQLLKRADLALYQAKSEGRRTYRVFHPDMEDKARRRHGLEIGLRSALKRGELRLVFQPQLDLASGGIAGCEALLRWESAEWGTVTPSEFIPVAEETGLIVPIGEWVLREAVREACRWPASVNVAVNLSPVQFRNRRLHATVIHALAQSGLPPGRLDLEITESTFIESTEEIAEILQSLRGLGVGVALDDFGSGYSSLNYLRRFPFDKIKIDKSFVDEIGVEESSTAIVRTIIGLAGALGMSTVAEGVETTEQLELLRELGCQQVQGYVFSRARSPADIMAMLAHQSDADKPDMLAATG